MRRTVITEYKSEKYVYDENEGDQLEPGMDVWMEECDIRDFSDMPKYGEFKSHDEAYEYLVKKFGKIE
jgi:hypothetical protein